MKKILTGIVAAAMVSSFAVAKEVKIGVVMPMSGPIGAFGQYADKGLKLVNELSPTLANGDTIKLVLVDNKSDKIESANGMQKLVSIMQILIIKDNAHVGRPTCTCIAFYCIHQKV